MVNLKVKPYNLNDEGIKWVEKTLSGMSVAEKVGQLFCLMGFTDDETILKKLTDELHVGGLMYRPGLGKDTQRIHKFLQENSKIPLLLAANLEAGGNGIATEGTNFGKPMQVGATDNAEMGYSLGKVACGEGAAVGCNWAFAPIVDIDVNFRNPITNLRTFGNNVDLVIKMASGYLRAADEEGVAVSIKHFPGDGVDERDQHLHTTINDLGCEEWDNTVGKVYRTLIDQGAKTVMVGHIAQPNYLKKLNPEANPFTPATLSSDLLNGLLREKLNFNGLIVTDATSMLGFTTFMPRSKAVPYSISAGCDMFLFTKNLEEDVKYMFAGVKDGTISSERLDEAVTRILATKASLNLHTKQKEGTLVPTEEALKTLKSDKNVVLAKQCADESVTLVKDTQNLLPLSPNKYKKILLNVLEEDDALDTPLRSAFKERLEKEGFEVIVRKRCKSLSASKIMAGGDSQELMEIFMEARESVEEFKAKYDLVLYVSNYEVASNNTVVRLEWRGLLGFGNDFPWFVEEIPTLFVSLANPYHLLDTPMIKTFVNAYTNNEYVLDSIFEKLMGRSEFKGKSPVDAFCGREDTKL